MTPLTPAHRRIVDLLARQAVRDHLTAKTAPQRANRSRRQNPPSTAQRQNT